MAIHFTKFRYNYNLTDKTCFATEYPYTSHPIEMLHILKVMKIEANSEK